MDCCSLGAGPHGSTVESARLTGSTVESAQFLQNLQGFACAGFQHSVSPCDAQKAGRPVGGTSMAQDHESMLDAEDTTRALMDSAGVAVARPVDSAGKEASGRWMRARGHWNKGLSLLRRVAAVAEPAVSVGFNAARNNAHSHLRAWQNF